MSDVVRHGMVVDAIAELASREITPVTTFHLVRHGANDLVDSVLCGRRVDVSLNDEGNRQACMLAQRFNRLPIARILASPLRRARETAQPIADALELELEMTGSLDEHDSGAWGGMTFRELSRDPRWRAWNTRRDITQPPGGESMSCLQERVIALLHRLACDDPKAEIVLVSHGEPIRAALLALNGIAIRDFMTIEVPAASVTSLSLLLAGTALLPAVRRHEICYLRPDRQFLLG